MVRLILFLARHVPQAVIVNSRATAATLPHARGLVVAAPGFEPAQLTSTPPQPEQPPVVGILGRISPTKGQLVFVQAAALVRDHYPEVRFRIIGQSLFGEDAYAERVRAEVQRLALSDIVEFIGHVTNPMAELDRLQLCVHASPTPEPFGQVIVEAMVRHIPVVATRGGGATEIMTPDPGAGPLGWLVEPNDPEGLATAILSALDDPADTAARAGNAFATASRRYPIAKTAEQITAVWRRVAPAR
ncbi:D-inositol-3-phosphate glycosyltransferase [bioreactor metagenome]|uniref:D-inositol-3-phosphate glycosyltransferase n=1 Tax=bioreactor metagenome TaxID=1076179 RepID=A0A645F3A2_9ZZZZ